VGVRVRKRVVPERGQQEERTFVHGVERALRPRLTDALADAGVRGKKLQRRTQGLCVHVDSARVEVGRLHFEIALEVLEVFHEFGAMLPRPAAPTNPKAGGESWRGAG